MARTPTQAGRNQRRNEYGSRSRKIGAELVRQFVAGNIELLFGTRGIPTDRGFIAQVWWKDRTKMPAIIDALNRCINSKAAAGALSENLTQALRDSAVVPRRPADRKNYKWTCPLDMIWEFSEEADHHVRKRRDDQRFGKRKSPPPGCSGLGDGESLLFAEVSLEPETWPALTPFNQHESTLEQESGMGFLKLDISSADLAAPNDQL